MRDFAVCLFGHRDLDDLREVYDRLYKLVSRLIGAEESLTFFVGRNGEFDECAASVIKRAQKELDRKNSELILVLPYSVADIEYYEKYYDCVIIPENLHGVHPKSAITAKNRWMIDRSDMVIVCARREHGGAYAAMKYAEQKNKRVINIYGDSFGESGDFSCI